MNNIIKFISVINYLSVSIVIGTVVCFGAVLFALGTLLLFSHTAGMLLSLIPLTYFTVVGMCVQKLYRMITAKISKRLQALGGVSPCSKGKLDS